MRHTHPDLSRASNAPSNLPLTSHDTHPHQLFYTSPISSVTTLINTSANTFDRYDPTSGATLYSTPTCAGDKNEDTETISNIWTKIVQLFELKLYSYYETILKRNSIRGGRKTIKAFTLPINIDFKSFRIDKSAGMIPSLCDAIIIACNFNLPGQSNKLLDTSLEALYQYLYPCNELLPSPKSLTNKRLGTVYLPRKSEHGSELLPLLYTLCAIAQRKCNVSSGSSSLFRIFPEMENPTQVESAPYIEEKKYNLELQHTIFSFALLSLYWISSSDIYGKTFDPTSKKQFPIVQMPMPSERVEFLINAFSTLNQVSDVCSPYFVTGEAIISHIIRLIWVTLLYSKLAYNSQTGKDVTNRFKNILEKEIESFIGQNYVGEDTDDSSCGHLKFEGRCVLLRSQMRNLSKDKMEFTNILRRIYGRIFEGKFKLNISDISGYIQNWRVISENKPTKKFIDIFAPLMKHFEQIGDEYEGFFDLSLRLFSSKNNLKETGNCPIESSHKKPTFESVQTGSHWSNWIFALNTISLKEFEDIYFNLLWNSYTVKQLLSTWEMQKSSEFRSSVCVKSTGEYDYSDAYVLFRIFKCPVSLYMLLQQSSKSCATLVNGLSSSNGHNQVNIFNLGATYSPLRYSLPETTKPLNISKQQSPVSLASQSTPIQRQPGGSILRKSSNCLQSTCFLSPRRSSTKRIKSISRNSSLSVQYRPPKYERLGGSNRMVSYSLKNSDFRKASRRLSSTNEITTKRSWRLGLRYSRRHTFRRIWRVCTSGNPQSAKKNIDPENGAIVNTISNNDSPSNFELVPSDISESDRLPTISEIPATININSIEISNENISTPNTTELGCLPDLYTSSAEDFSGAHSHSDYSAPTTYLQYSKKREKNDSIDSSNCSISRENNKLSWIQMKSILKKPRPMSTNPKILFDQEQTSDIDSCSADESDCDFLKFEHSASQRYPKSPVREHNTVNAETIGTSQPYEGQYNRDTFTSLEEVPITLGKTKKRVTFLLDDKKEIKEKTIKIVQERFRQFYLPSDGEPELDEYQSAPSETANDFEYGIIQKYPSNSYPCNSIVSSDIFAHSPQNALNASLVHNWNPYTKAEDDYDSNSIYSFEIPTPLEMSVGYSGSTRLERDMAGMNASIGRDSTITSRSSTLYGSGYATSKRRLR